MILALDFDGVLHDFKNPIEGKRMGAPISGALEATEALTDQGHGLIVFTVNNIENVENWLDYYGFGDFIVTNTKPQADWYIDDKAIHFTDWQSILNRFPEED